MNTAKIVHEIDVSHLGPRYEPELVIVFGLKVFREKFTDLRGLVDFASRENEHGQPRFVKIYFTAEDPIDEIPDFTLVKSHNVILPDYINFIMSDEDRQSLVEDLQSNWKSSLDHHERIFTLRPRRMTL